MTHLDVLPSSLMDLNVSLNWKHRKSKELGISSLARSTLGLERCARAPGGTKKRDKHQLLKWACTKPNIRWLMHSWSIFDVRTSHGQTRTHKTHHGPNLGEATTFPLIVYFVSLHEAHIQMTFCPGTPKWESRNSQIGIPAILGPHNFACKPLIEIRFEAKL